MDGYTEIKHDGFARYSIIRRLSETNKTCGWCGSKRKSGKLFNYGTLSDGFGARPQFDDEDFCSLSCHNTYYC